MRDKSVSSAQQAITHYIKIKGRFRTSRPIFRIVFLARVTRIIVRLTRARSSKINKIIKLILNKLFLTNSSDKVTWYSPSCSSLLSPSVGEELGNRCKVISDSFSRATYLIRRWYRTYNSTTRGAMIKPIRCVVRFLFSPVVFLSRPAWHW